MAVNLRADPAKGMTLPFISYGGSSLLALGLGMGFLVALTRKNLVVAHVPQHAGAGVSAPRGVLLAAGGTGGHLFPAGVAGRRAARRRGVAGRSGHRRPRAEIRRAIFPPARSMPFPRRRTTGAGLAEQGARRRRRWRAASSRALSLIRRLQPARGRRLRRLSHRAAAARRLAARRAQRAARAERGDGPRQPVPRPARVADRDRLSRSQRRRRGAARRRATPAIPSARRCSRPPSAPYPDFAATDG